MLKAISAILISILICSCSYPKKEQENQALNKITIDTTANERTKDAFDRDSYWSNLLKHLDEPDLKTSTKEAYRFMLFQAFDTCLVLFRIEKDSVNKVRLTTKYYLEEHLDGTGKDTVLKVLKKNLTIKDWEKLDEKVRESYFWTLEAYDNPEVNGTDGSSWTIEGRRFPSKYEIDRHIEFKEYTIVGRRSPNKGSFHELGITIAKMSNELYEKEIY